MHLDLLTLAARLLEGFRKIVKGPLNGRWNTWLVSHNDRAMSTG
jgi:hypothetical protein